MTGLDPIAVVDDPDTLRMIAATLTQAADDYQPVRFSTADEGLKLSVGRGTWSPPLGQVLP